MPPIFTKISIIATIVIIIGGSLTFVMTWQNIGFVEGFLLSWITSFALCVFCIAPIGGVISMLINKSLNTLLPNITTMQLNILFGLCMAMIMESVMSLVTTYNLNGYTSNQDFFGLWFASLLMALPIGIIFSILLSVIVKPKLQQFWANN